MSQAQHETAGDDPVDDIVAACLESPPHAVLAAVDSACSTHPEHAAAIRRRVAALRDLGLVDTAERIDAEPSFPERLGEFRLLRRLGGGGMGVVYLARQESLGRDVALKLIRPENMFFPRARERFRRETEAVARLQHPGIVPIYTVGEERGLPYFAMELVDGCTLAELVHELRGCAPESLRASDLCEALERRGSSERERSGSALFEGGWVEACVRIAIQVAEALHHAHGRGVLHRDVKPSNIALTRDGRALVLDFGLASLEHAQGMTQTGSALGSLLYMSPEQIRGDQAAIDRRADVYSLGVTLYELLTLQVPYYDTNPVGTRLAILDGRADPLRARNRMVSKDLETVCLKAMEREAAQRYADLEAFANDLRNVLALRPIAARPPGAALRARRWVQRNPAIATALGLGAVLVIGVPTALYLQQRAYAEEIGQERDAARIEARDAEGVAEFMAGLFDAADPAFAMGREPAAGELLDLGVERIQRELAGQPDVEARLLERMGQAYTSLGRYSDAEPLLERSLELRRELYGDESLEVARALFALGHLRRMTGATDARAMLERAVALRESLGASHDEQFARCLVAVAMAHSGERRFDDALAWYDRALETAESLDGDQRELFTLVLSNRATTLQQMQRFDDAITDAREAIELEHSIGRAPRAGLVASLNTLALSLASQGRLQEARPVYEELIEVGARLYGESSVSFATLAMNEASLLDRLGESAEARERLESALAIFERSLPAAHPQRLACTTNLAGLCARSHDDARARELYERALPHLVEREGQDSARVTAVLEKLGLACDALGDAAEAERRLRAALGVDPAQTKPSGARSARLRVHLANVVRRDPERLAEAAALFEAALEGSGDEAAEPAVAVIALAGLAAIELAAGSDLDGARARLEDADERAAQVEEGHWAAAFARGVRAEWLEASGERPRARIEAQGAAVDLERALGPSHPLAVEARARADRLR